MGTRVFVRLYEASTQQEGEEEIVALSQPPLKWDEVVPILVHAVWKQPHPPPEDVKQLRPRVFLLSQGIAAELNARAMRFGIRENDQLALCLNGEAYQKPVEATQTSTTVAAPSTTTPAQTPTDPVYESSTNDAYEQRAAPPGGLISTSSEGSGAPGGSILGQSAGNNRKGTKRYRSISGKMAAIKALGDKGLISADDRGLLKDLLLHNDSSALQDALDTYNNTGDFQAVKELLLQELRNPSAKRGTSEWLSESLINDIALNFNTNDEEESPLAASSTGSSTSREAPVYAMNSESLDMASLMNDYSSVSALPNPASSVSSPVGPAVSASTPTYTQQPKSSMQWSSPSMNSAYSQQANSNGNMYAVPQINLPLRDRNTMNMLMKRTGYTGNGYQSPATPMMSQPSPTTPTTPMDSNYNMHYSSYSPAMSYNNNMGAMSMNQYMTSPMMQSPMGTSNLYMLQQQQATYGMNPFAYSNMSMGTMGAYNGVYHQNGAYGFGTMRPAGGRTKWTTAPPMPSYPPPCSKEEKKEKIARWLKKRENRNWSNKPSYPVRHSIAKARKRGEDGRFITKAKLAEMEAAEAAAKAAESSGTGAAVPVESPSA